MMFREVVCANRLSCCFGSSYGMSNRMIDLHHEPSHLVTVIFACLHALSRAQVPKLHL